jgi:hypothetical protein
LRGASSCCPVTFFLIRARASCWPVTARVAPSKGVCPAAVHRRGCCRPTSETGAGVPTTPSTDRRVERRSLWDLYKPTAHTLPSAKFPHCDHACCGSSSPVEGRNAPYFSQLPLQSPLINAQRHIGPQAFGMTVQRALLRRRPLRAHPDAPHCRQGTCDSPCTPPQRGADLGLSHRLQSFRTAQNSSAGHLCAMPHTAGLDPPAAHLSHREHQPPTSPHGATPSWSRTSCATASGGRRPKGPSREHQGPHRPQPRGQFPRGVRAVLRFVDEHPGASRTGGVG